MKEHKEIELKFPLTESEYRLLKNKLSQNLSRIDLDQNDFVIKLKSGENLRIRREQNQTLLTHKKRIYNSQDHFLYCQEAECVLDKNHLDEIKSILKQLNVSITDEQLDLDYPEFKAWLQHALSSQSSYSVNIHKQRSEFKQSPYTYVLDWVENLGYFLEIEQLVPLADKTNEEELRQQIRHKLLDLELTDRENLIQGYTVLMHEKNLKENESPPISKQNAKTIC